MGRGLVFSGVGGRGVGGDRVDPGAGVRPGREGVGLLEPDTKFCRGTFSSMLEPCSASNVKGAAFSTTVAAFRGTPVGLEWICRATALDRLFGDVGGGRRILTGRRLCGRASSPIVIVFVALAEAGSKPEPGSHSYWGPSPLEPEASNSTSSSPAPFQLPGGGGEGAVGGTYSGRCRWPGRWR